MSQSVRFQTRVGVTESTDLDLGTREWTPTFNVQQTWADGTSSNQSDLNYVIEGTVSSSPVDVDLQNLTKQLGGGSLSFVEITAIGLYNTSASYHLYLYQSASNPVGWLPSSTYALWCAPAGSITLSNPTTGFAVGASTDNLRIASHTGASVDYYLCLIGRSA